jgi:hypothetical protein
MMNGLLAVSSFFMSGKKLKKRKEIKVRIVKYNHTSELIIPQGYFFSFSVETNGNNKYKVRVRILLYNECIE